MRTIPESWGQNSACWQGTPFRWQRWERPHDGWTHDHCEFCHACICDHRERFPHEKAAQAERGCYRHAYYAERPDRTYTWVCRTCFTRVRAEFGWEEAY